MDMTGWMEYFVEGLATQMREVTQRGERVIRRDVIARKLRLSGRQRAALGYALEHGGLTIKDFESLQPDVNRRTLQRDLKAMVGKGVFVPEGATNRLFYRLGKLDT